MKNIIRTITTAAAGTAAAASLFVAPAAHALPPRDQGTANPTTIGDHCTRLAKPWDHTISPPAKLPSFVLAGLFLTSKDRRLFAAQTTHGRQTVETSPLAYRRNVTWPSAHATMTRSKANPYALPSKNCCNTVHTRNRPDNTRHLHSYGEILTRNIRRGFRTATALER